MIQLQKCRICYLLQNSAFWEFNLSFLNKCKSLVSTALFELKWGWSKLEWFWKDCSKKSRWKRAWDTEWGPNPYASVQTVLQSGSGLVVLSGGFVTGSSGCTCAHEHSGTHARRQKEEKTTVSVPDCDIHTSIWPWSTPAPSTWLM